MSSHYDDAVPPCQKRARSGHFVITRVETIDGSPAGGGRS
jgi:hypothetical protein